MFDLEFTRALEHIVVFILAGLLIYYSFLLLKRLNSKDLAISMIFLHEKTISNIFLIIVIGSLLFLLGQTFYSLSSDVNTENFLRITAIIYSIALLYFAYKLQKVLKGGVINE